MWKQDLEELLKVWPNSRLIQQITATVGGFVIVDTDGDRWKFNCYECHLYKIERKEVDE